LYAKPLCYYSQSLALLLVSWAQGIPTLTYKNNLSQKISMTGLTIEHRF